MPDGDNEEVKFGSSEWWNRLWRRRFEGQPSPTPTPVKPGTIEAKEADIQTIMGWGLPRADAERMVVTKPGEGYSVGNITLAPNGNYRVTWTPPPTEPTGDLTPQQQEQKFREQLEFEWQLGARITPWQQFQMQQQRRELAQRGQQPGLDMGGLRRELASEFDAWKAQQMLALERGGPRNWIKRFFLEKLRLPEVAEGAEPSRPTVMTNPPWLGPEATPFQLGSDEPASTFDPFQHGIIPPTVKRDAGGGATGATRAQLAREEFRIPPSFPGALSQLIPGLTPGEPISKVPVRTPSGQLWARTPESTKQMFAGYLDWVGQPFGDVLGQMAMMQPQDPIGARFRRWQPARQVA